MRQTLPMARRLAAPPPPLHPPRKPMALTPAARIHKLALPKPGRTQHRANRHQALLGPHAELDNLRLGRHTAGGKHAQVLPRQLPRRPPPVADLDRPVPVHVGALVAHHLAPVELQHRARRALRRLRVEHGRHALFHGQHAGAVRRRVRFALERGALAQRLGGEAGRGVEAVGLGGGFEDRADCAFLRVVDEVRG